MAQQRYVIQYYRGSKRVGQMTFKAGLASAIKAAINGAPYGSKGQNIRVYEVPRRIGDSAEEVLRITSSGRVSGAKSDLVSRDEIQAQMTRAGL
jgi:hypothetical protein